MTICMSAKQWTQATFVNGILSLLLFMAWGCCCFYPKLRKGLCFLLLCCTKYNLFVVLVVVVVVVCVWEGVHQLATRNEYYGLPF